MSADLLLVRARLRRDVPAASLARLLVPEEPGAQIGAAHRLVWALFANSSDRRRDFLWRKTGPGEFLILAARPPADPHGLFALEWKPFAPALRRGQRLGFDLRANPVTSIPRGPEERGKRTDVVMHALHAVPSGERAAARAATIERAGTNWLARQGAKAGFAAEPDALRIDGYETARVPRGPGERPIIYSALEFQGVLTVEDPARFLGALPHGFGAAKAFGCGLMLIRRARR